MIDVDYLRRARASAADSNSACRVNSMRIKFFLRDSTGVFTKVGLVTCKGAQFVVVLPYGHRLTSPPPK
jgi:hypothetical protein